MERAGEMGDIGREALHEGVLQGGSDTGEHKDKTVGHEKDEQFQVQYIITCVHVCSSNSVPFFLPS